jgi:hypothetical protein
MRRWLLIGFWLGGLRYVDPEAEQCWEICVVDADADGIGCIFSGDTLHVG